MNSYLENNTYFVLRNNKAFFSFRFHFRESEKRRRVGYEKNYNVIRVESRNNGAHRGKKMGFGVRIILSQHFFFYFEKEGRKNIA